MVSNEQVKEWLCELITAEGFAYGYLKLTYCLRRNFNLVINKKKVYRLCKELAILRPQRKVKHKHPKPAGQEPGHYGFQSALGGRC